MFTGYCPKPEPTPPRDIFFADNLGPIFIRMQGNPARVLCETASGPAHLSREFCAEAFPIKASHKAEIGMSAEGDWGRFDWHKILGWSPFARLSAFTEMGHFHVCEYAPDLEKRSH